MGLEGLLDPDEDGSQGSDRPITVVETATGNKLTGEEAPMLSQLQEWLSQNPGWEVADTDDEDSDDEEESRVFYVLFYLFHSILYIFRSER